MPQRVLLVFARALLCALPLTAACGGAQEPAAPPGPVLRARLEFDTGASRPVGLLAFDLDGDGADELVTLARGPGALRVESGLSNRPERAHSTAQMSVGDYALGPVRVGAWRSGRDEGPALAAIAQREDPALVLVDVRALFLARGEPLVARLELESRPRVIGSGDLGADGQPEIAVVTLEDELLVVRAGQVVLRHALSDAQATCVHFTADGRALLVGSQATRRVVRYVPDGESGLRAEGAVELRGLPRRIDELDGWRGATGARFVVAAGDRDLVWLDESLQVVALEELAAVPIDVTHAGTAGRRALLATSVHGQQARVEREDGAAVVLYAGQHPVAGVLGDFDGDGVLDAAFANSDAKRVSLAFGRAQGGFELARFAPSGRAPHALAAGDFDGDGHADVVALCALDATLRMHRGTGGGLEAGVSQGPAPGANRVRAADLDGDGRLDVAFLRETDRGVVLDLWFGDGRGRLWSRGETAPVVCASSPGDLLVLDLDGDGRFEALVTDPAASRIVLVPIDVSAEGLVTIGAPVPQELAGTPRELALAGRASDRSFIAVALEAQGPRRGWALLSASRAEISETQHEALPDRPRGIAVDLATSTLAWLGGEDAASTLTVFERSTKPGFALERHSAGEGGLRAYAVRAADLDGDRRTDFVVSAQNSHHLNLWLSRARGRVADLGVGTGPLDLILVDLDGDGVSEIVVACAFSDELAVVALR
ncbi:MAG: VCBS repeat-containing protein [Planctomycetes bacterium]|nr:VCBS repeat-containing protein [Planctomycetota bacterium]